MKYGLTVTDQHVVNKMHREGKSLMEIALFVQAPPEVVAKFLPKPQEQKQVSATESEVDEQSPAPAKRGRKPKIVPLVDSAVANLGQPVNPWDDDTDEPVE